MIDQLRAVPESWTVGKIKHAGDVTLGKMLQSSAKGDGDIELPYMRAANVQPDGVLKVDDVKSMWFSERELSQLTLERGDVVVVEGGIGGYGRAAFVDRDLDAWGFQNSINRIRPYDACDGRFIAYYLIAARHSGFIEAYCNVVSMPHLTVDKLESMPCPLPPLDQQHAIADYLDRETAKIDALIEKQKRLIASLGERRRAVVSHALRSEQTRPLKQFATVILGKMLDAGKGVPEGSEVRKYLRAANVTKAGMVGFDDLKEMPFMPGEAARLDLRSGDVLVVEGGAVGRPAYLHEDLKSMSFQKTLNRVRAHAGMADGRYLYYALDDLEKAGFHSTIEATAMPHLTAEKLVQVPVPERSLDEQRQIAADLDHKTAGIDRVAEKARRFIELSRERRAALITAAVTGQIDVPGAA